MVLITIVTGAYKPWIFPISQKLSLHPPWFLGSRIALCQDAQGGLHRGRGLAFRGVLQREIAATDFQSLEWDNYGYIQIIILIYIYI